jgi:MFS family permease
LTTTEGNRAGLRERAFVPVLVYVGLVVAIVSSLGAPLIPTIAADLHASISSAQWALTATLVVGAVASPIVGRLGDGRHRRPMILLCLAIVSIGGALAAVAGSLPVLIVGRAMQGMGLALVPLTMAAARDHLGELDSRRTIATLSVITAVGVGLGYPITGLIAEHGGLEAAFWLGAGMTVLALALSALVIPDTRDSARRQRLDGPGAVTIAVGLVALLIAIEKGPDWGWGAARTLGLLALAVVVLGLWVARELAADEPLVDLRLVRHRAVLTANLGGGLLGVAMYMALALMTQFVQLPDSAGFGLGSTVFVAGLTLTPLSVGSFVASRFLPGLQRRVGLRPVVAAGTAVVGLGMLFFALTAEQLWQAFVTMAIIGVGLGLTYAALPGLIVSAIPQSETGSAMGFYQVSRYVGFSIGSGLSVTLLRVFGSGGEPTLSAYRGAFGVGAAVCAATAIVCWIVPGRRTASDSGDASASVQRFEAEEGILGAAGLPMLDDRSSRADVLDPIAAWARGRPDVRALALVGSRARGTARPDSDLDLVLLANDPAPYVDDDAWARALGVAPTGVVRRWGPVVERRFAGPDGLELEVVVGTAAWAAIDPLDDGTRRVVADGLRILHDPDGLLERLVAAVSRSSPRSAP